MAESIRVLIVEDLPTDAELCEREIRKTLGSCEFLRVETREEYLSALDKFCPAFIVSDYRLPLFDGMTALKLAVERCPDVPFIVLTGSMNEDTAVECMKAGAWERDADTMTDVNPPARLPAKMGAMITYRPPRGELVMSRLRPPAQRAHYRPETHTWAPLVPSP